MRLQFRVVALQDVVLDARQLGRHGVRRVQVLRLRKGLRRQDVLVLQQQERSLASRAASISRYLPCCCAFDARLSHGVWLTGLQYF